MSLVEQNDRDNYSIGSNVSDPLDDTDLYHDEYSEHNDIASVESSVAFSVVEKRNGNKNKKNDKPEDKGYRKIKTSQGSLEYYSTSIIPGAPIRDAIYGQYDFTMKVGSSDEDLFFKIINKSNGIDRMKEDHLFYDNPDQCERHMGINVSQHVKEQWTEKYQRALDRLQLDDN
jgi:hypothetical protein